MSTCSSSWRLRNRSKNLVADFGSGEGNSLLIVIQIAQVWDHLNDNLHVLPKERMHVVAGMGGAN